MCAWSVLDNMIGTRSTPRRTTGWSFGPPFLYMAMHGSQGPPPWATTHLVAGMRCVVTGFAVCRSSIDQRPPPTRNHAFPVSQAIALYHT